MRAYSSGFLVATGAEQNVSLGWIPDKVKITNLTDRDHIYEAPVARIIRFDGGGNEEIKAGYTIEASDKGWKATVRQVLRAAGSWAGGDASGFLVLDADSLTGAANIANNDTIRVARTSDATPAGDWATVNGAGLMPLSLDTSAAVAAAAATAQVRPYLGTPAASARGFSVGSTIGAAGELLFYEAWAATAAQGSLA